MKVYLSGAMEGACDEGAGWRNELSGWLKKELGHKVIDPVVETQRIVKKNSAHDYRNWKTENPQKFVKFVRQLIDHDLAAVSKESNYLICLWNKDVLTGGGTHGEVTMAYFSGKPVYLVCELQPDELSGWILSCSTEIFQDFTALKSRLRQLYG